MALDNRRQSQYIANPVMYIDFVFKQFKVLLAEWKVKKPCNANGVFRYKYANVNKP